MRAGRRPRSRRPDPCTRSSRRPAARRVAPRSRAGAGWSRRWPRDACRAPPRRSRTMRGHGSFAGPELAGRRDGLDGRRVDDLVAQRERQALALARPDHRCVRDAVRHVAKAAAVLAHDEGGAVARRAQVGHVVAGVGHAEAAGRGGGAARIEGGRRRRLSPHPLARTRRTSASARRRDERGRIDEASACGRRAPPSSAWRIDPARHSWNRSDITSTPASQAWFRQGRPKAPSSVLVSE